MNKDRKDIIRLLNTAKGQLDGIIKMIEDERYCLDISNQLLATTSIVKKANSKIINNHLESCVKNAIENGDSEAKIEEVKILIEKLMKNS